MARGGTREQAPWPLAKPSPPSSHPPTPPRSSPLLPSPPRGPLLAAAGGSGGGGRRHEAGSPRSRAGRRGIPGARAREVRARVGRRGRRAEGGEPSRAGRRGGGTARRPRPRLAEPALRRLRTRSLCLSPLDGGGAVAGTAARGSAGDGEPSCTRASSRRPLPSGAGGAAPRSERTRRLRRGASPGADSLVPGQWARSAGA